MRKALALVIFFVVFVGSIQSVSADQIGVILPGNALGFYKGVTKGIKQATEDMHVDMLERSPTDGASLEVQSNIQLKLIDYMVQRGVIGIILAPEPLLGVKTPVSIPVPTVLVDRNNMDYNAISTVATDNYAAGRAAALSLSHVLHKGSKVAVLRLAANIISTTERENGFVSVAREKGWKIAVDTFVGFQLRESQKLTDKALKGYAGRIDAVFAPAESVSYGALRVIETMPAQTRPYLVAFDWRPEFMDALKNGTLYAAVLQDPYRMGYMAVKTLVEFTRGSPPPPQRQLIGVVTVTQENLSSPSVKAAIANNSE